MQPLKYNTHHASTSRLQACSIEPSRTHRCCQSQYDTYSRSATALQSKGPLRAAATRATAMDLHQHCIQYDAQQLPAGAAGLYQQLRRSSESLATAVQPSQSQQKHEKHMQQATHSPWRYDAAGAALAQQFKSAGTWHELQQLVQQYQPDQQQGRQQQGIELLNPQLLTGLLRALVRCQQPPALSKKAASGDDDVQLTQFADAAFSQLLLLLSDMQPRELSTVLWAASKLHQPPSITKLKRILMRMNHRDVLAAANAQDVSMCLYAVASLGIQVADEQVEGLLAAFAARLGAAAPQAVSNTLWAIAVLQCRPSEQWLAQVEETCSRHLQQQAAIAADCGAATATQQQQVAGFSHKGLHQLLWSFAKLQWVPQHMFVTSYWSVTSHQLAYMTPHGTTGILWAAATLGLQPPEPWLDIWFKNTALQMQNGRFNHQDMANSLWAVVRLGLKPGESWLQQGLVTAERVSAGAGAQELSMMLWGVAKLKMRPTGTWMAVWLDAMYARMSSYCAPALACSAYSLALLRFKPQRSWCECLVGEVQRQMPAFGAQELSNIMWALATLGLKPNSAWFRDFQQQALNESSSFNAQELSVLCWAMAKLHHTPPADWVAALLRDGLEAHHDICGQSVVLLMWALARWRLTDIRENGKYRMLLPRYWAATQQLLPSCTLWQLSVLWWARVQLGCMPSKRWSRSFWAVLTPLLTAATGEAAEAAGQDALVAKQCAATVATGAAVQPQHRGQQLRSLVTQQQQQQQPLRRIFDPSYNVTTVVRLVFAAGKLPGIVPQEAQHLLLTAAQQCLPSCSLNSSSTLGLGLLRLHRRAAQVSVAAEPQQHRQLTAVLPKRLDSRSREAKEQKQAFYQQVRQHALLWNHWFSRSADLLQPQGCIPHHQRHQHGTGDADSIDIGLQLFIAGQLAAVVQPPASWQRAVVAAVAEHWKAMSAEQLSWVLWAVVTLRLEQQLPDSWLHDVLRSFNMSSPAGATGHPAVMLRMHRAVKNLRLFGALQQVDWELWWGSYQERLRGQRLYVPRASNQPC